MAIADKTAGISLREWLALSRPAFHTVGILPFCLGTLLAWQLDGVYNGEVFVLGLLAVVLIMLSTYHAGECFDLREDTLSQAAFPSRFAGGSGVMPAGRVSVRIPFFSSMAAIGIAAIIGLVLQLLYQTGPYTLLLGCLGALPGFFYSTRPIRLVQTGWGEPFIGFCYGWLPVASAFYIQTAYLHPMIHWVSVPIALSITNVILINEFPDYEADRTVGKRNLLVRLGKAWVKGIYITLCVLSWIAMFLSVRAGVPGSALYVYIPVIALSLIVMALLAAGKDRNPQALEALCALTIAVNLATTTAYLVAFWK